MGLIDLFRHEQAASLLDNKAEVLRRYKHLRAVGLRMNSRLVSTLSKQSLTTGARRLGMLEGNDVIALGTEDESAVLMDYCLHDVRHKGRNAIEQFLIDSPPPDDSDEMVYLRAKTQAFYSVLEVEKAERGLGVAMRDLVTGKSLVVVDLGFGSSADVGLLIAGRLLPVEDWHMTSGAALPLGILPAHLREEAARDLRQMLRSDGGTFDPAPVIRMCLEEGLSQRIRYQSLPGERSEPPRRSISAQKIGRNDRCPCGSGKKYKHCCLRGE